METANLISKYFSEGLTSEEARQLEALLNENPEQREAFDFEKNLRSGLMADEKQELKAQLQEFEKNLAIPERQSRSLNKRWMAIAASLVLFASLGVWLWQQNQSSRLYDDYFQGYEQTEMVITRNAPQSLKRAAFNAYDMEDYEQAISYLEQIKAAEQTDYVDFYLGLSHLQLGDADKALPYFETVIAQDSKYAAEALWYAALGQLKIKNKQRAANYLSQLLNKGGFKQQEAKALLEDIQ